MFKVVQGMRTIEFGAPGKSRSNLIDMIIHGNKRATAGLLSDYIAEGEPVEHVGEKLGVLDNNDELVAVIQIVEVDQLRFADVPDRFAIAEAEGDLNAEDFRASHRLYWEAAGQEISDDTTVVTLYFDLVEILDSKRDVTE